MIEWELLFLKKDKKKWEKVVKCLLIFDSEVDIFVIEFELIEVFVVE